MDAVAIINSGFGNLRNLCRGVRLAGCEPRILERPDGLEDFSHVILPGVGAFPKAMEALNKLGFSDKLKGLVADKRITLLGVCLGMQLLADESEEAGGAKGLGLIPGKVVFLEPTEEKEPVPHVGWNELYYDEGHDLLADVPSGKDFYFVHSLSFYPGNPDSAIATTPYCGEFVSVVGKGMVMGTQFHPELSSHHGIQILRNFLAM